MTLIQLKGGTTSEWTTANPVLAFREPGIEFNVNGADLVGIKFGNGRDTWNELPYFASGGGSLPGDGVVHWLDIAERPATFPPEIGTTGSTAAAGNHTHSQAAIIAALGYTPQNAVQKGAAGGYAPLGSDGKVPAANLPAANAGGVTSVASRTGAVTLTATDAPGINTEQQNALNAKVASTDVKNIVKISEAAYAALATKDNLTLYLEY